MTITVFRDVTPCILLDRYHRFGGMCCFNLQDRRILYSYTLKLEAASPFERLVIIYEATRRHVPETCNIHSHCHVNLKSRM
jgi:hypothetical protein